MGYVPENYKLIQMKDGQKKGQDKKKSKNHGYNAQHYDESRDMEAEAYSQGKHMYQSEHHYSKYGQSALDSQYDYKDSSQRGGRKNPSIKDEQQSINSRSKYDQKDRNSRQGLYGEGDDLSSHHGNNKMERQNYYGSKYGNEDPHKGYMNSNYIYNQPDYSKASHISNSGSKRGGKGEEHSGQQRGGKQSYMGGPHKKEVEVNNIMLNTPQSGYYQPYHPYGHISTGQPYQSGKKGHKYYDVGYGTGEEILDSADVGEQDKLAMLMHMGKSEEHIEPFDRRLHSEQIYPQYGKT